MRMIKKILVVLLILIISDLFSQDYWLRVPSPTSRWLTRSFLLDTIFGWAAGDSGTIIHTSNGGASWVNQNSGITGLPIDDIFFIDRNNGWALANDYLFDLGTYMLKTADGGNNWNISRFPDTSVVIGEIYFIDVNTGFATGFSGRIFKTTNGGVKWDDTRIDTSFCPYLYMFPKKDIEFLNAQTGYACGGHIDIQGIIWKTTNGGSHWFTWCVAPEPLLDIKILNSSRIVCTGGDFEYGASVALTYNGGNNWLYDTTGLFGQGQSLAFRTAAEVWVPLGFGQSWALNLDSANFQSRWYEIPAPDSTSIYTADFVTPTYGFGFGSWGAIVKYNTAVIGIANQQNLTPLRSRLNQNYPNPFNPSTVITYYLKKQEFVKITIYDLLGKQLKVYPEGYKPAGTNKFSFQNFGLASGAYFYKIEAGDFTETKKMVIIK